MQTKDKIIYVYLTSHSFSGSTLTAFLMNTHPDITTVGELSGPGFHLDPRVYPCSCGRSFVEDPFWSDVAKFVNQQGVKFSPGSYLDTSFYLDNNRLISRARTGSLRSNFLEHVRDHVLSTVWPGHRSSMLERLQRNEAFARAILNVTGKQIFLDTSKDPMRIRYLQQSEIIDLYIIHLVRDVRGVVASTLRRNPKCTAQQAATAWLWRERNIQRHLKTLPPSRKILVRYESLATDTLTTLNEIFSFLGADSLDEIVDYRQVEHHILGNKMRKRSSSEIKLDERWRTSLTKTQLREINAIVPFADGTKLYV